MKSVSTYISSSLTNIQSILPQVGTGTASITINAGISFGKPLIVIIGLLVAPAGTSFTSILQAKPITMSALYVIEYDAEKRVPVEAVTLLSEEEPYFFNLLFAKLELI